MNEDSILEWLLENYCQVTTIAKNIDFKGEVDTNVSLLTEQTEIHHEIDKAKMSASNHFVLVTKGFLSVLVDSESFTPKYSDSDSDVVIIGTYGDKPVYLQQNYSTETLSIVKVASGSKIKFTDVIYFSGKRT